MERGIPQTPCQKNPKKPKNSTIITADIPAKMENMLKQDFFVSLNRLYCIETEKTPPTN